MMILLTENKCDSTTLPRTQSHECSVNADCEVVAPLAETLDTVTVVVVFVLRLVLNGLLMEILVRMRVHDGLGLDEGGGRSDER